MGILDRDYYKRDEEDEAEKIKIAKASLNNLDFFQDRPEENFKSQRESGFKVIHESSRVRPKIVRKPKKAKRDYRFLKSFMIWVLVIAGLFTVFNHSEIYTKSVYKAVSFHTPGQKEYRF